LLTPEIVFLGEVDRRDKIDLLGRAACTLVPSQWDEPFGLVMIESLACGTPVVALRAGSAPEIVEHGVTGYLASNFDELVRFAARVSDLDPAACRRAAEERFTAEGMVNAYERVYVGLADDGHEPRSRRQPASCS
jgi:glycosyltransferase involved in cell wall biosynthesis